MNGDVPADEDWLDCEFCLEFSTGPIQTRMRAYEAGEGHVIEPRDGPFALDMQLDDGWVAAWDHKADGGPPYLICPYHARGERVPRPSEVAMVGDVVVDPRNAFSGKREVDLKCNALT